MASSNFARAMAQVFRYEGGYVNNPRDPGGPTNFGITLATLRAWRGSPVSASDVKALTRDEAARIYRQNYWRPVHADDLPPGVDLCIFDYAVNSGPGRAAKALQSILGVTEDGVIGPETIAAALTTGKTPAELINRICDERLAYLRRLNTWPTFGRGWAARIAAVRKEAISELDGRLVPPDSKVSKGQATAASGAVVALGAGAAAVSAGVPWGWVVGAAAIAAIVAFIAYQVWMKRYV